MKKNKIPYKIINDEKQYTFPNGISKLTATKTEVVQKEPIKTSDNLDIISQIEKFFKDGGKIKCIESESRSIPEFAWHRDNYPKNYRR